MAGAPNEWPRCTAERREHRMPRNGRGPRGPGNRGMGDRPMDEMAEPGAEMGTPEEGDETMDTGEMEGGSMPRRRVARRRARRAVGRARTRRTVARAGVRRTAR